MHQRNNVLQRAGSLLYLYKLHDAWFNNNTKSVSIALWQQASRKWPPRCGFLNKLPAEQWPLFPLWGRCHNNTHWSCHLSSLSKPDTDSVVMMSSIMYINKNKKVNCCTHDTLNLLCVIFLQRRWLHLTDKFTIIRTIKFAVAGHVGIWLLRYWKYFTS